MASPVLIKIVAHINSRSRPPSWLEEHLGPPIYGFMYDGEQLHPKSGVLKRETKAYMITNVQWSNVVLPTGNSESCQTRRVTPSALQIRGK